MEKFTTVRTLSLRILSSLIALWLVTTVPSPSNTVLAEGCGGTTGSTSC